MTDLRDKSPLFRADRTEGEIQNPKAEITERCLQILTMIGKIATGTNYCTRDTLRPQSDAKRPYRLKKQFRHSCYPIQGIPIPRETYSR